MGHEKIGVGIPSNYRKDADHKVDVLWKVTIKGRKMLTEDIPLHMSLRVFDSLDDKAFKEVKNKVKQLKICTPDSKKLKFKTTIFHSRHTHVDYYLLKISGVDESCTEFFAHFKNGYGFSHDKFMPHITIDKDLYDRINKEGLEPEEVKFDNLTVEDGADNTVYAFDHKEGFDDMSKSLKHIGTALAVAGALAGSPSKAGQVPSALSPNPPAHHENIKVAPVALQTQTANPYNSHKMLNTISAVESTHGQNENHKPLGGIHQGESAFGKYGLTPVTIRETIHMNRGLQQKYGKAMKLKGDDMKRFMEDNPGLEDKIAAAHLQRLEHHFGQNPSRIGYAWLNGIRGTNKALKNKTDIENHWHVQKIKNAWTKEK